MTSTSFSPKTILITGATAGIGLAAACDIAASGGLIIGVGRSPERCQAAAEEIQKHAPQAGVHFLQADLSSQRSIHQLAQQASQLIQEKSGGKLDVLVNNAGAVASWYTTTEDGYELQFAVNHLAPFLLTNLLLPNLQQAPAARVITTSSASHRRMRIFWGDVMMRRFYNTLLAYKQSKLANVLFTCQFNRRMAGQPIRAYAVDPGLVNTQIGLKGTAGISRWVWESRRKGGVSPQQGAATIVHLACTGVLEDANAPYWKDCRPRQADRYALREEEAARLWALSEKLCGLGE